MNQFPRMLYKHGGPEQIHGGQFHTLVAQDQDQQDAALAKGWHLTTPDAVEAVKGTTAGGTGQTGDQQDDAPPTREEMKAKAAELGLAYPHNISNVKLAELIDAALAKG